MQKRYIKRKNILVQSYFLAEVLSIANVVYATCDHGNITF